MAYIYELSSEDLSSFGNQGGETTLRWRKYYYSRETAQEAAQKDFNKRSDLVEDQEKIIWSHPRGDDWIAQDLGLTSYRIRKIYVRDRP